MGSSEAPSRAAPSEVHNRAAAEAAKSLPPDLFPTCGATLPAPRAACPQCRRQGWCPECGHALVRAHTARCQYCAAPTACPYCGYTFRAGAGDPCPACRRSVICQCGYDLNRNTDARCPECWRPVEPLLRGPGLWPPLPEAEERRTQLAVGIMVWLVRIAAVFAVIVALMLAAVFVLVIVLALGGC